MSIKGRIKLINRMAQVTQTKQPGPTSVAGNPMAVDVVSLFTDVPKVWGFNNISKIQQIINIINQAIYVLSDAQIDFNQLRLAYFNIDTSKYSNIVLQAIIRLASVIYMQMLTDKTKQRTQPLSSQEKQQIIAHISQSLNVSAIPDGSINNFLQTKVGNFKEVLKGILFTIT